MFDPALTRRRGDSHQHVGSFWLRRDLVLATWAGHDRRQRKDTIGVVDGDQLSDEASHRDPNDMSRANAQPAQESRGIVGEAK